MANPTKSPETLKSDAFEIIELAIDELDTLTRAFDLIADICEEANHPKVRLEEAPVKTVLN